MAASHLVRHPRRAAHEICRARAGARRGRARWLDAARAAANTAAEIGSRRTWGRCVAAPSGATRTRAQRWTATTARTLKVVHGHLRRLIRRLRPIRRLYRPFHRRHRARRPRSASRAWNHAVARTQHTRASESAASVAARTATRRACSCAPTTARGTARSCPTQRQTLPLLRQARIRA